MPGSCDDIAAGMHSSLKRRGISEGSDCRCVKTPTGTTKKKPRRRGSVGLSPEYQYANVRRDDAVSWGVPRPTITITPYNYNAVASILFLDHFA